MGFSTQRILHDPNLNGIYRLDTPSEVIPSLDGKVVADKETLLEAVGWALGFPDYYGANWDALEECLTDMSWQSGPILLHITHSDAISPGVLVTFIEIFADAALGWREAGRVCSLFISGEAHPELAQAE